MVVAFFFVASAIILSIANPLSAEEKTERGEERKDAGFAAAADILTAALLAHPNLWGFGDGQGAEMRAAVIATAHGAQFPVQIDILPSDIVTTADMPYRNFMLCHACASMSAFAAEGQIFTETFHDKIENKEALLVDGLRLQNHGHRIARQTMETVAADFQKYYRYRQRHIALICETDGCAQKNYFKEETECLFENTEKDEWEDFNPDRTPPNECIHAGADPRGFFDDAHAPPVWGGAIQYSNSMSSDKCEDCLFLRIIGPLNITIGMYVPAKVI